ncbi:hypothetical protein ASF32_14795 [Methylobacterium sp. Leaf91]|nr:hypothetical protein ASF32_14795 [Methylobacterium sp. Leaf91]
MRVQDRRQRARVDLQFVRHLHRDPRWPGKPSVTKITGGVEEELFSSFTINKAPRLLRLIQVTLPSFEDQLGGARFAKVDPLAIVTHALFGKYAGDKRDSLTSICGGTHLS